MLNPLKRGEKQKLCREIREGSAMERVSVEGLIFSAAL